VRDTVRNGLSPNKYNYNEPGAMQMAYRIPDNLVGDDLR
jgi:hypothetical protein